MEDPDIPVFLLNRQCGAYGLTLTAASHIFLVEPGFGAQLVNEEQAVARAHRLGQQGPLLVRRYVYAGASAAALCSMTRSLAQSLCAWPAHVLCAATVQ